MHFAVRLGRLTFPGFGNKGHREREWDGLGWGKEPRVPKGKMVGRE